uniref:isoleucine--tRNA ligase n=2 Tax=Lepeophtheirus salmonis TaxID=72036 RepID=A0A0K2TEQ2_LEPSM
MSRILRSPLSKSLYRICLYSSSKNPYASTVLLPKTDFPAKITGKNRIEKDEVILEILKKRRKNEDVTAKYNYVIHDGPPYANGRLHLGHAVNKILKDILCRRQRSLGKSVHFRPGWDCHGLPIELKALKDTKRAYNPKDLREKCRSFAFDAVEEQRKEFESWAIDAAWCNPYITCKPDYVKKQFVLFGKLLMQEKMIFRDLLPVYWSPSSRTALAESELEYHNKKSSSIYVKFPLSDDRYALIWTTTPWSLFSNRAICYAPGAKYVFAEFKEMKGHYLVAEALLHNLPFQVKSVEPVLEDNFKDLKYLNIHNQVCSLIESNHVKIDSGTGLVHTAPCHGHEDFKVGKIAKLDLENRYIDADGRLNFQNNNGHTLHGTSIFEDDKIIHFFKDSIIHEEKIVHSYPFDWRSKKPVIVVTSNQWFFDTKKVSKIAHEIVNKHVDIIPSNRKQFFMENLLIRPYWCISRQRTWGVPIPVFYDKIKDTPVVNEMLIERCSQLVDSFGTDFWWSLSDEEILKGTGLDHKDLRKGKDIFDVWFDSGISWSHLPNKQADIYIEGQDQLNGWFYTSLMTSTACRKLSPFKKIFVHGFTMDDKGKKMSKSLGNVVSPSDIIQGSREKKSKKFITPYGVDVLRYWVAAHGSQSSSILVTEGSLADSKIEIDKIRNALRFCMGNLKDFDDVSVPPTTMLDKYLRHRITILDDEMSECYENMNFGKICRSLSNFITNDLSALYFLGAKDRLYCDDVHSLPRKSAVFTLKVLLEFMLHWIQPILPILTEEISMHTKIYQHSISSFKFLNQQVYDEVAQLLEKRDYILKQMGNQRWTLVVKSRPPYSTSLSDLREILRADQIVEEEKGDPGSIQFSLLNSEFAALPGVSLIPCQRCKLNKCEKEETICQRCESIILGK